MSHLRIVNPDTLQEVLLITDENQVIDLVLTDDEETETDTDKESDATH